MAGKLAEAEELVKKAEKCLKTSFLKWSPDVDSAIDYYSKAAVIYRNARKLQEAANTYMQIAKLHAQNGSFFHCAKAHEAAALLFRDLGDHKKIAECIKIAGQLMRQNGVPDSATTLYAKGAKLLESVRPEDSAMFYEYAADTSELEEKYLQAADFASQAARLWTRLQRYKDADAQLRYAMRLACSEISDNGVQSAYQVCGKAVVALVIIKLIQEDSVAAGKVYDEAMTKYHFGDTDDAGAVARLLQVYESCDPAAASEVLSQPTFRNLESEFARLARSIKFSESFGDQKTAVMTAAGSVADDDEPEDIC